jgi:hypothetical protein
MLSDEERIQTMRIVEDFLKHNGIVPSEVVMQFPSTVLNKKVRPVDYVKEFSSVKLKA